MAVFSWSGAPLMPHGIASTGRALCAGAMGVVAHHVEQPAWFTLAKVAAKSKARSIGRHERSAVHVHGVKRPALIEASSVRLFSAPCPRTQKSNKLLKGLWWSPEALHHCPSRAATIASIAC